MKTVVPIFVVCENTDCRCHAAQVCDELSKRYPPDTEFDLTFLSFEDTSDHERFRRTVDKAAESKVLVFSMSPGCDLPSAVHDWIEAWLARRGEHEGAILALGDPGHTPAGGVSRNFIYLRSIAHRAGLDYLTEMPEKIIETIPDELESYSKRARQVTSVLNQILHQQHTEKARRNLALVH